VERPHSRTLITAAVGVWIAAAAIRWAICSPLGHDEARYALSARALLHGHLPRWDYVPPGVAALGVPGLLLGAGERAMRLVPLVANLGLLAAAFAIARRFSRDTAAWTLAVLAGTLPLLRLSTDLLSDIPSAALVLAGLAVLLGELDWRIVVVAPLFAAAFYVRYGSCIPIAIIAIAVLAFRLRELRLAPAAATLGLFALLLVPHLLQSHAIDGSALGIIKASAAMPAPGRGLADYALHPFHHFGLLGPALIVIAIAGAMRDRRRAMLVVIAVAQIVVLGLQTQAQPRYVFVALVLFAIVAVDTLKPHLARVALAVVAATWLVVVVSAVRSKHELELENAHTLASAAVVRADDAGRPCFVMGRKRMQLEWYSGCESTLWPHVPLGRLYAVRDDYGGPDQPDFAVLPGTHVQLAPDIIRCDAAP